MLSVTALVLASSLETMPAPLARDPWDAYELRGLQATRPHVAELLQKGEAFGVAGAVADAEAVFQQIMQEASDSGLVWRRHCEALTALGRRKEAIEACERAVQNSRIPSNFRALVRAYVDGPTPPSTADVLEALRMLALQSPRGTDSPTPAAMACGIAEAIGDGVMLQHCAEVLERVAPHHVETKRALQALSLRCPPPRFWIGWTGMIAAFVATVVHACRRRIGRLEVLRSMMVAAALTLPALPVVARAAGPARDGISQWPVDDAHPEKSIPSEQARNSQPLQFGYWLQDLAFKANQASKRGDHAAAVRFFKAMATAVPDRAIAYSKLCAEYEAMHDLDDAILACGDALLHDGVTVQDYSHFVRLIMAKPGELDIKDQAALQLVLKHMRDDPSGRNAVDELACEVAVRTSNVPQLRECTTALVARAPNDPQTIKFQWALAIQEGHLDLADKLVARARAMGIPIDEMQRTTDIDRRVERKRIFLTLVTIGLLVAAALVLRRGLRRRNAPAAHASSLAGSGGALEGAKTEPGPPPPPESTTA